MVMSNNEILAQSIMYFITLVLAIIKTVYLLICKKHSNAFLKEGIHISFVFFLLAKTYTFIGSYAANMTPIPDKYVYVFDLTQVITDHISKIGIVSAYSLLIVYWIGIYEDVFEIRKGKIFTKRTKPLFISLISIFLALEFLVILGKFKLFHNKFRLEIERVELYYTKAMLFILCIIFFAIKGYLFYGQKALSKMTKIKLFSSGILVTCSIFIYTIFTFMIVPGPNGEQFFFWLTCIYFNWLVLYTLFVVYGRDLRTFYEKIFNYFGFENKESSKAMDSVPEPAISNSINVQHDEENGVTPYGESAYTDSTFSDSINTTITTNSNIIEE
ncbi:hypothetical protein CYY_000093 [Polysphondylium violaceum]|uniref:THH1/TOM1/TOM3 domain-containing protein n=1 Tax=Polysphondylium violaceum TaxID=133409 RepID=A0A8J4Q281_9MYCE|nr:hypothetical protein CYY_000093 [Polysphondylium violaceum]